MRRITWRATRAPAWEPRAGYADRWKSNQMFQGTALFFSNYDSSHLSPFLKGLTFYASSISYSAWLDSFTFFYLFFHFLHTFLSHYTKEVKSIFRWWTRSLAILKERKVSLLFCRRTCTRLALALWKENEVIFLFCTHARIHLIFS